MTQNAQYLSYVDFFSHNDMDMMEIGNGDLTIEEQRTHFAAWIFMKSPILLGTEVSWFSRLGPVFPASSKEEECLSLFCLYTTRAH